MLLVTSRVTLVPDNYLGFLQSVMEFSCEYVAGLALLDNLEVQTAKQAAGLAVAQAWKLSTTLTANALSSLVLSKDKRVQLFGQKNIPVLFASHMGDAKILEFIKNNGVDLIVNARTRHIYLQSTLLAPKLGCINIHHGLLPEERGVNCDLFAMAENKPAGFSIHVMTDKIDAGRILLREEVPYDPSDKDYLNLQYRSSLAEARALAKVLSEIHLLGTLPYGIPNTSTEIKFRRVKPSFKTIQLFKKQGVKL